MLLSKADELRAKATYCDKLAEAAKDIEAKLFFREAANEWRQLATHTERQESGSFKTGRP